MFLYNIRVISPDPAGGADIDFFADVYINNGKFEFIDVTQCSRDTKLAGKILVPGFVDMHSHLRVPGFEYKEELATGIASAQAGGYTAVCAMANTKPVIDSPELLQQVEAQAKGIELHQYSAITKGLDGKELVDFAALKKAGAIAFSDDGRPLENMAVYKRALATGNLISSHAEDSSLFVDPLGEIIAVAREIELARATGGRLHFSHLSTARSIELVRAAKKEGLCVTCETTPHHFSLTSESETSNGQFKMNPPLRTRVDVEAIIAGLQDGTIDAIATDHAPHSLEEKQRAFKDSPFGVVGFETAFSLAYTMLVQTGKLTLLEVIKKMSTNPARILGLSNQGFLAVGRAANCVILDLNATHIVQAANFKSKCKISPFEAMQLSAQVCATIYQGELVSGKI